METPSRRAKTDWSHVANLPDNCSVQPTRGHLYVVRRTYTYDKESKRTHEKRTTLGQIVDNVFYTNDEYKAKFKRGMKKRKEPRIEDLIYDNNLIENLGKEQISRLSNMVTTGMAGAVPMLWHIVKESGLYDDLLSAFKSHVLVAKIISLACFFITSDKSNVKYYGEFSKTHYLPCNEVLSSQEIINFYGEIASNDNFRKRLFAERVKRLAKQDILLVVDSIGIASSDWQYSLCQAKNDKSRNNEHIDLAIIFNARTHEPICCRTVPVDAHDFRSCLELLADLSNFEGLQKCMAILDRDYCNIDNICLAQDMDTRCCMALTLQSSWACEFVDKALPELDKQDNVLRGGEVSGVTVPACALDNSGINRKFWIHIFKDKYVELSTTGAFFKAIEEFENLWFSKSGKVESILERDEIKYFTYDKNNIERQLARNIEEIKNQLKYAGCFAFVTTYECLAQECYDIYDLGSDMERVFKFDIKNMSSDVRNDIKNDIHFDVLRTHEIRTFEGEILISFVALSILEHAKQELAKERLTKSKSGKVVVEIPANYYDIDDVLNISRNIRFHRRPISGEIFYLSPNEEQNKVAIAMGCENIYMNGAEY